MMKTTVFFLCMLVLFNGCKKKTQESEKAIIEYQVSASNATDVAVSYNNVLEDKVPLNVQNGWFFDVTIYQKPFHAYIQASASSPTSTVQATCTVRILVNGNVVKTATVTSNTGAPVEAAFTVQ